MVLLHLLAAWLLSVHT